MGEMTLEAALDLAKSEVWKSWTDEEVVKFQLFQSRLCIDWSHFHGAVERVLGRPVWSHEFAFVDQLRAEYMKERTAPTFQEILNLIPADKRIILIDTTEAANDPPA